MSKVKFVVRWIDVVNKWIGENIGLLLLPMVCVATMEVILRYVFNRPTIWAWDLNIQLEAALVSLAGGYVLLCGRFVIVDVFVSRLSAKARARLDLATSIIIFFAVSTLVWLGIKEAWHSWMMRERLASIWMPPIYPLRFIVAIGFILLFLQLISMAIHLFLVATGKESPVLPKERKGH